MITHISQLDFNKTYTTAEYLQWQLQERVELLWGRIFKMSPAPSSRHQLISGKFEWHLSPGNSRKEMREKYDLYEQCGIGEYWADIALFLKAHFRSILLWSLTASGIGVGYSIKISFK